MINYNNKDSMVFAAIDIGSNAGRLLVAAVMEYKDKPVTEKISIVRVPLRLGMDVFENGQISPYREEMLIRTFKAYKELMSVFHPLGFEACATAAMRDASNGSHILQRVKDLTGIKLKIIDGLTEAKVISAAGNLNLKKPHEYSLYIDVGGGSTEFTWYHKDTLLAAQSFEIGTIRLLYDLVKKEEWKTLKEWIADLGINGKPLNCICSGGNINKLTKLFGNKQHYTLTYQQLCDGYDYLKEFTVEERINKLGMRADRADVIVPAAYAFKKIMKWAGIEELQSPKIGLADGLIIDLYKKYKGESTILV